jgi:hypothetical protein
VIFPLDLRQERLDVVQIPPGFQPHLVGAGAIGSRSRPGIFDHLQSGTQRLIHHAPKRRPKLYRNGFRFVQNIVVYGKGCSHGVIIASCGVMSRHHFSPLPPAFFRSALRDQIGKQEQEAPMDRREYTDHAILLLHRLICA